MKTKIIFVIVILSSVMATGIYYAFMNASDKEEFTKPLIEDLITPDKEKDTHVYENIIYLEEAMDIVAKELGTSKDELMFVNAQILKDSVESKYILDILIKDIVYCFIVDASNGEIESSNKVLITEYDGISTIESNSMD